MKTFALAAFTIMISFNVLGKDIEKTDIRNRWKAPSGLPSVQGKAQSIYFPLRARDKGIVVIKNAEPFSVFINRQLVLNNQNQVAWSLDSLKSAYVFPITITVFNQQKLLSLSTHLVHAKASSDLLNRNYRASVIALVAFILIWLLIILFKSNGMVMQEYFNFSKVFSIRRTDESILSQRVTALSNIFVYMFCSVLTAVNFILLTEDSSTEPLVFLGHLVRLSSIILMFFLIKIIVISIAARVFNLSERVPNQFFNFVKLLLGCFTISSILLILIFIFGGKSGFFGESFGIFILIMFGLYLAATFLRLLTRGGFTVFHLFSYLCISEIIPAILFLKTL